jgi:PAS domain S-box-containing protein
MNTPLSSYYWYITLDWVLLTVGTLLITLQGSIPSWASILFSNSMLIGGTFVLCFGLSRFAGKKHNPIIVSAVFVVLAIFLAIQGYFLYVQNDLVVRSYNVAIGLLLAFALGIWLMFKGVSPEIRRISKGTGIAFVILAFISFIRIMGFTLIPQTSNQFLQSGKFDTTVVALLVGAMAYLVFNLVLMVNKRLYFESIEIQNEANISEMEFHTTFQTTSVGFGILVNRVIKEANDAYCQLLGYSWEEILGKETRMFFPTDEEYRTFGQIYQKVAEFGSATAETRLLHKNGEILNVIATISPFDKNDLSKGVVFSVLDITGRKKLEENNVYLASFPEMNIYPILELDQAGNLKYQNPACKHIFPELPTLGLKHPFFASWTSAIQELQGAKTVQPCIYDVTVDNLVYEQAYFAIGKNQIRIYTRDITKRKQAEEKLADSETSVVSQ